jgi:hypothetical protein
MTLEQMQQGYLSRMLPVERQRFLSGVNETTTGTLSSPAGVPSFTRNEPTTRWPTFPTEDEQRQYDFTKYQTNRAAEAASSVTNRMAQEYGQAVDASAGAERQYRTMMEGMAQGVYPEGWPQNAPLADVPRMAPTASATPMPAAAPVAPAAQPSVTPSATAAASPVGLQNLQRPQQKEPPNVYVSLMPTADDAAFIANQGQGVRGAAAVRAALGLGPVQYQKAYQQAKEGFLQRREAEKDRQAQLEALRTRGEAEKGVQQIKSIGEYMAQGVKSKGEVDAAELRKQADIFTARMARLARKDAAEESRNMKYYGMWLGSVEARRELANRMYLSQFKAREAEVLKMRDQATEAQINEAYAIGTKGVAELMASLKKYEGDEAALGALAQNNDVVPIVLLLDALEGTTGNADLKKQLLDSASKMMADQMGGERGRLAYLKGTSAGR